MYTFTPSFSPTYTWSFFPGFIWEIPGRSRNSFNHFNSSSLSSCFFFPILALESKRTQNLLVISCSTFLRFSGLFGRYFSTFFFSTFQLSLFSSLVFERTWFFRYPGYCCLRRVWRCLKCLQLQLLSYLFSTFSQRILLFLLSVLLTII